MFIEVLLVTLIIHNLLERRGQQERLNKMNMVIGAFFSETGLKLLSLFAGYNADTPDSSDKMEFNANWTKHDYTEARRYFSSKGLMVEAQKGDLDALKEFLLNRRTFLLDLLRNPILLEHESFTNLLWAVFHLTEELAMRKSLKKLTANDLSHLSGDIKRAYNLLVLEWLGYLKHLEKAYPYLFPWQCAPILLTPKLRWR